MFKKLSLRIKLTMITTITIILISVMLTVVSVQNANSGFAYLQTNRDTVTNEPNTEGERNIIPEEEINGDKKSNYTVPFMGRERGLSTADSRDDTATIVAINLFKINAYIYMVIIISISSIFIYFILGKVLKPVKRLSTEIGIINENKLSQRIAGFNSGDEISELAGSFNIMLDRLDRAFESQKRFSLDAAHELKTPLTALKSNIDILDMDEDASMEDYKYTVDVFRKQTDRMISLVNNLFTLAEQKSYDFIDDIKLDKVIEEILKDLEVKIKEKNLQVYFNKSNVSITGNSIMVTHALSNIVQNAIKYNNKNGSIFINVENYVDKCSIVFKDTGVGIPEDKVEHIFDAFYRVDQSRSRKIGGAGLGLAITKDIIKNHGGTIEYFPNEEGGSIFKITLPLHT